MVFIRTSSLSLNTVILELFFFQAEDGIRDRTVTGVQTCALPISWCHPTILKITPGGALNAFATIPDSFFAQGVAIDRSDNLFVMAIGWSDNVSIIFKLTPEGRRRSFGFVPGHGLGLAFDSAGNLFVADATNRTVYKFAPGWHTEHIRWSRSFHQFREWPY